MKSKFFLPFALCGILFSCENDIAPIDAPVEETPSPTLFAPPPPPPCGVPYCCAYSNPGSSGVSVPTPSQHGNGSFSTTYNSGTITVDTPYENGTLVYYLPDDYKYTVSFQIQKFGNPVAAQLTAGAMTYTATSSWQSYTYVAPDYGPLTLPLHTITYGSYGGVQVQNLVISAVPRPSCTQTCTNPCPCINPWQNVTLTSGLFTLLGGSTGSHTLSVLSSTSVKFTAVDAANFQYILNTDPLYEYELNWSMAYSLPVLSGAETGVYPDMGHEYYSANNCGPGNVNCAYGKVGEDYTDANGVLVHFYNPAGTIFTNMATFPNGAVNNTIMFRTSVANAAGGSMTINNFALKRRLKCP